MSRLVIIEEGEGMEDSSISNYVANNHSNKRPCMMTDNMHKSCQIISSYDNEPAESLQGRQFSAGWALSTPEIVENILKFIEKKNIKNYRLVNRVFNQEICRCLQKSSYIHLEESSVEQMRSYANILKSIRENKFQTSSPFRRYYLIGQQLDSEFLDEILHEPESVIALRLNQAPSKNNSKFQKNLDKILTKNQSTIAAFYCTLKGGVNLAYTEDEGKSQTTSIGEKKKWFFPNLTEIEFVDCDDLPKTESIGFLVDLINASPHIVRFAPICNDENVVYEIMSRCDLSRVEDFYFPEITPRQVQLLNTLSLPLLQELAVCGRDESEGNIFTLDSLQQLTSAFSKTLEVLLINLPCSEVGDYFTCCPILKELRIGSFFGSLGTFTEEKFPQLKQITVFKIEYRNSIVRPHHGVETFVLVCPTAARSLSTIREAYEYFAYYLAQQFPNLKNLHLSCIMTEEMMRLIITELPKLKLLDITTESFIPENMFTGINKYQLWRCLSNNVNPYTQSKTSCLPDLKRLKTLSLKGCNQSVIGVTNHAVRYGICNIPRLKHLRIDWAADLSVPVVSQSLSHLLSLTINNPLDFPSDEIKARLKEAMPQTTIF